MSGTGSEWKAGIFGCFTDFRLCCLTFCVPCYTVGKNAEHFGEDCLVHGLLYGLGLNFGPLLRWRLRQEKALQGSMLIDVLVHTIIPCCALVQEAKEIGWNMPEAVANMGKKKEAATTEAAPAAEDPAPAEKTEEMTRE